MAGALKRIAGPAFLANSATDIYTPANSAVFTVINHIHLCNVTAGAVTVTMYVGATGGSSAGTQIFAGLSIPANSTYDWYATPGLRMASTDFLSGLASAATSITVVVMGTFQAS